MRESHRWLSMQRLLKPDVAIHPSANCNVNDQRAGIRGRYWEANPIIKGRLMMARSHTRLVE